MNYYLLALKKYAVFSGRASRKEYWMFVLFSFLITIVLGIIEGAALNYSNQGLLTNIYSLAVLVPSIAAGIRRMHDVNKSGWFILVPIYNLVLACTAGTKGNNTYGPEPKQASAA